MSNHVWHDGVGGVGGGGGGVGGGGGCRRGIVGGGDLAMTLVSRQARAPGAPPAEEVGLHSRPPARKSRLVPCVCVGPTH